MFPQYLQYLLTDFRQTFVVGASRDRDALIAFWGQKVKCQGHTIAAEAHSTRRYRRVQLFLVVVVVVITLATSLHEWRRYCGARHLCVSVCVFPAVTARPKTALVSAVFLVIIFFCTTLGSIDHEG